MKKNVFNIIKFGGLSLVIYLSFSTSSVAQQENTALTFSNTTSLSGQNAATLNGEQSSLDSWSANSNITLAINTDEVKFGESSISGKTSASGVYDRLEYRFPSEPGVSYKVSLWAKKEAGNTQALTQWEGVEDFEVQYIDSSSWKRYEQVVVATDSEIVIRAYASIQGKAGDDLYIDGLNITLTNLSGQNAATLNGEKASLDSWSANSNITLEVNTDEVKFGDSSISGKTSASGVYDRLEYRFPSEPGTSYTISLWAKREAGSTQALTQWEGVEDFEVQYIDTPFWKRYTQNVIATDNEIVIRAYASIQGEAGDDIYIDGLNVTKNLSGQNAATLNGEQSSLDSWSANSNITLAINTDEAKFGESSISGKTSASGVYDRLEYRFPSEPGVSYKVSLWAKKEAGNTQALTQWEGVEDFEVQYIDSSSWKRYEQVVVATDGEIVIRAYASIQGEAGDDLYIDGLNITSYDNEILVSEPPTILDRLTDPGLPNLIASQNPNFDGTEGWRVEVRGHVYSSDSHISDGSGSIELISNNQLSGPSFACENGQRYVLSAYMKILNSSRGQNVRIQVHGGSTYWNTSNNGEWEEVLIPFIPDTEDGKCFIFIGTDIRSFSTTFVDYPDRPEFEIRPEQVRQDGSNLDTTPRVFIDNVKVVRSDQIPPRETISTKTHFEGPYVRIDDLGNFTVKKNNEWIPIFPKMMHVSRHGDENLSVSERIYQRSLRYVEYGFNGVVGVFRLERDVISPLEAGIEYVTVSTSQPFRRDGVDFIKQLIPELKDYLDQVGKPEAFLWYYYDNENTWVQSSGHKEKLSNIISELDSDPVTQKRQHPFFMLNGNYGLARAYLNDTTEIMDFTGAYSTLGGAGQLVGEPKETLGVIDKSHNQKAPSPLIQLQCYHHEQFVPALFFGIIQGGKALSMWRDGTEYTPINDRACEFNFEDNIWAPAVKGEDGIFARLDTMLPLIREPHWTRWSASSTHKNIRIGTRDYAGDHYMILSNHSDQPITANVSIDGIEITGAEDYFTGDFIGSSSDDGSTINIPVGHHNNGYRVVRFLTN